MPVYRLVDSLNGIGFFLGYPQDFFGVIIIVDSTYNTLLAGLSLLGSLVRTTNCRRSKTLLIVIIIIIGFVKAIARVFSYQ